MNQQDILNKYKNIISNMNNNSTNAFDELRKLQKEIKSGLSEKENKILEDFNLQASKLPKGDKEALIKLKDSFIKKATNDTV